MLTLLFLLVLMPVLVFVMIAVQRLHFGNSAEPYSADDERRDREWELYQERYD